MAVTSEILPDEPGLLLEYHEVYDTDPEDLWQAITTPERLARFMAVHRGEFRLGGRWQAFGTDGEVYCDGEVTACDRPHGFTTTWTVVGEQPTLLTVLLEPDGPRTRLHLRHEHVTRPEYGPGWHAYLEALAAHLAEPDAERDRDAWVHRVQQLAPGYAQRLAELGAAAADG